MTRNKIESPCLILQEKPLSWELLIQTKFTAMDDDNWIIFDCLEKTNNVQINSRNVPGFFCLLSYFNNGFYPNEVPFKIWNPPNLEVFLDISLLYCNDVSVD